MKKTICLMLCLSLLMLCSKSTAFAQSDETTASQIEESEHVKPLLSELSEEECLDFIIKQGIKVPRSIENSDLTSFVKTIIRKIEQDPDATFVISSTATVNFVEAIRSVVNEYYGRTVIDTSSTMSQSAVLSASQLQDSILYGTWSPNMALYNCYAFAIGVNYALDPGYLKYLDDLIPDSNYETYYLDTLDPDILADYVMEDLGVLDHVRINKQDDPVDTSTLCVNEQVICVRSGSKDYHFMRYENGVWLHKPGNTHPLQYKYSPTNNRPWTNEAVKSNGGYEGPTTTYDSTIVYIRYDGHNWYSYTNHNTGTHSRLCSICGDSESEKCDLEFVSSGSSGHYQKCSLCGYRSTTVAHKMTYSYTSSNKHKATCSQCGYTTTESCNSSGYQYYGQVDGVHKHRTACNKCNHVTGTTLISCLFKGTSTVCSQCKHDKGISGGTIMKKPIQTEQQ